MKSIAILRWCLRWLGVSVIPAAMFTTGCGTLKDGRAWGQDAIYPVRWKRIGAAAKKAVTDPVTWISASGAAVFAIDDFDQKTSDWATEHTPLFGSMSVADKASDHLRNALEAETMVTWLFTASGSDFPEWTLSKARGGVVEYAALRTSDATINLLKNQTRRLRPDQDDYRSFPSQHAAAAFANARLSNRNLDSIELSPWARTSLKAGNLIVAGGTAWARVEAGRHYPSDVLVGACLGNLLTTFIHDAFMNLPETKGFTFYIEPSPRHIFGGVSFDF